MDDDQLAAFRKAYELRRAQKVLEGLDFDIPVTCSFQRVGGVCTDPASWLMACARCAAPPWFPVCDRCRTEARMTTTGVVCRRCKARGSFRDMFQWRELVKA